MSLCAVSLRRRDGLRATGPWTVEEKTADHADDRGFLAPKGLQKLAWGVSPRITAASFSPAPEGAAESSSRPRSVPAIIAV
jgi:hypothetical protein